MLASLLVTDGGLTDDGRAEQVVDSVQVWETFDGGNCQTEPTNHVGEVNVNLKWAYGDESSMAGQQRADALAAEDCSQWLNGAGVDAATPLAGGVELEMTARVVRGENQVDSGIELKAGITPTRDLPESVALRWFITVDHSPLGEREVNDLVLHFGWSSTFFHDEGNITNWTEFIDEERLAMDGIPLADEDLWRIEVALLVMDDLNQSVLAATNVQIPTPSSVPGRGGVVPVSMVVVALMVGYALIIRGEKIREEGLPRLSGTLRRNDKSWMVKVTIAAGNRDATLKGASAEAPWRIGRVASQQLIPSETVRVFQATMRCSDDELTEAVTHWEIDVDDLGGWVLDLKLLPPEAVGDLIKVADGSSDNDC